MKIPIIKIILAGLISLLLSITSVIIIEELGYLNDLKDYFFPGLNDFGAFKALVTNNWFKGTRDIMLLLFLIALMHIFLFTIIFELIAIIYFIISVKWFKPKVFISYKNSNKNDEVNTTKIATGIKAHLEKKGFNVLFLKFSEQLSHDQVVFQIQGMLKACSAMIVIPDPYHPSYVDSEILYASTEQKPVFIIKHTDDQQLPNTANSGHTVFLWQKLKKEQFEPLNYLLEYVHGYWKSKLYIIYTPLIGFIMPITLLEDDDHFWKVIIIFALVTLLLVFSSTTIASLLLILKIGISAIGCFAGFITIKEIFKTTQFQKIIKQSILNKGNTYDHYVDAELKNNIIDCLDKKGLIIKENKTKQSLKTN
jgi:hypothetical protein